ncbi:MAG: tryptophan synthase subunit alpha [Acidobacteria bacterium]|nr:tryptophan synthase subunit alpha [Acidobacteriota bacterium]
MSRIAETFDTLRREGKRALIPFITAGDPHLEATLSLILELARAGAGVIELGVPFSDPVADGPVIQRASERALRHNVGVAEVLETVAQARRETDVPVVLFSYFNLDGVLVTDLVPEEERDFSDILAHEGLDQIFLVAPTTTDARLRLVAERARGFIYAVSRAGVTGARTEISAEAEKLVARVRRASDLPIAVGFGITTREHVSEVWRYADAAVVGSAIVAEIEQHAEDPRLVDCVGSFARSLIPS